MGKFIRFIAYSLLVIVVSSVTVFLDHYEYDLIKAKEDAQKIEKNDHDVR